MEEQTTFKLKVECNETVIKEVEISLPHYRVASGFLYYKVLSESECVKVCNVSMFPSIEKSLTYLCFGKDSKECTVDDFTDAYIYVSDKLNQLAL